MNTGRYWNTHSLQKSVCQLEGYQHVNPGASVDMSVVDELTGRIEELEQSLRVKDMELATVRSAGYKATNSSIVAGRVPRCAR